MKKVQTDKRLQQLYFQALDRLSFLSAGVVEDEAGDAATELLLLEAAYAAACFSRAARTAPGGDAMGEEKRELRRHIGGLIRLMSGSGKERFNGFLAGYFGGAAIRQEAGRLLERIHAAVYSGTLPELKADEAFQDDVLELFLFTDRYACLTHPKDSPVAFAKAGLKAVKPAVSRLFEELRPVFNVFAPMLATYRGNVFVPREPEYGWWYSVSRMPVEDFVAAMERASAAPDALDQEAFRALAASLPARLRQLLAPLQLEAQIGSLAARLGRKAAAFFNQARDLVAAPPAVPGFESMLREPSWSYGGFTRRQKSPEIPAEGSLSLLRARYRDDLQKALAKVAADTSLSPRERRELCAFACVLSGDEDALKKFLNKKPAKKQTR